MTSQISLINPYLLDTNVFIAAHRSYYPLSLCPGFWDVLTHYSQQGRVLSIDRVRNEILNGDELASWVRQARPLSRLRDEASDQGRLHPGRAPALYASRELLPTDENGG